MRLTRFSDIGLRVLMYLGSASPERGPVTVAEIARQFDIPLNHLIKVVAQLSRVGWVSAVRGRNGGLRLAPEAGVLTIGTILRELEGDAELIDCDGNGCSLNLNCRLRGALVVGMQAFYKAMDGFTLAQMSDGKTGEQIVLMHRMFLSAPMTRLETQ